MAHLQSAQPRAPLAPSHTGEGEETAQDSGRTQSYRSLLGLPQGYILSLQQGLVPTSSPPRSHFLMCSYTRGHSCFLSVRFHVVVAALRIALGGKYRSEEENETFGGDRV